MGSVYRIVIANLLRVNLRNDAELAAKIVAVLRPLQEAWTIVSRLDEGVAAGDGVTLQHLETASQAAQAATL